LICITCLLFGIIRSLCKRSSVTFIPGFAELWFLCYSFAIFSVGRALSLLSFCLIFLLWCNWSFSLRWFLLLLFLLFLFFFNFRFFWCNFLLWSSSSSCDWFLFLLFLFFFNFRFFSCNFLLWSSSSSCDWFLFLLLQRIDFVLDNIIISSLGLIQLISKESVVRIIWVECISIVCDEVDFLWQLFIGRFEKRLIFGCFLWARGCLVLRVGFSFLVLRASWFLLFGEGNSANVIPY